MRRTDTLIKLISIIVFLALVFYMGYAFYAAKSDPLRTVLAVSMELSDGVDTEGYAVREEQVVTASGGSIYVTAKEGQRVSSGAPVAVAYNGAEALQRADSIRSIELQIEQVQAALGGKTLEESARDTVLSLSSAVGRGDLSGLDAIMLNIDTYITGSGVGEDVQQLELTLSNLNARLDGLLEEQGGTTAIPAPYSGVFSFYVDGYESVSPENFSGSTTPENVRELFASPSPVSENTEGKLVGGIKWYYVTVMDSASAAKLSSASTIQVAFSRTYSSTISMNVESTGAVDSEGKCVVVLSSGEYLQDVLGVRDMTGRTIFSHTSGISVPKEAMHIDDEGQTYIYVLKGLQAQRTDVTILGESGEHYMVDSEDTELRLGDEIITRAGDIYDGAVVTG